MRPDGAQEGQAGETLNLPAIVRRAQMASVPELQLPLVSRKEENRLRA